MSEHLLAELQQLEDAIRKSDGDGLRDRWKSGYYLNKLKDGEKQLPRGLRKELIVRFNVRGSDINNRIAFAVQYSEAKLSTALERGLSWTEVRKTLKKKSQTTATDAGDEAERKRARKNIQRVMETMRVLDQRDQLLLNQLAAMLKDQMASTRTQTKAAA
jgi:hypothetical protein